MMTEEEQKQAHEDWITEPLAKMFTVGWRMGVFKLPGVVYDRLTHVTVMAVSHEDTANSMNFTTLAIRAHVAKGHFEREGKDWTKATAALKLHLGKDSTAYRWIVISRDTEDGLLDFVAKWPEIPMSYILGNKYIVGKGLEAKQRLPFEWAQVAFNNWAEARARAGKTGKDMCSGTDFVKDFCLPAYQAKWWVGAQIHAFGVVATGFPAFQRGVDFLKTLRGCKLIQAWLADKELHARPNFGVEELNALVDEMKRAKAGRAKPASPGGTAPGDEGAGPGAVPGEGAEAGAGEGAGQAALSATDAEGNIELTEDVVEDPLVAKLSQLAEAEEQQISLHSTVESWAKEIQAWIFPTSRPVMVIDCPSSRPQTFHKLLEQADKVSSVFPIFVPCNARLDLLGNVQAALSKKFPQRQNYIVSFGVKEQNRRTRPALGIYMAMDNENAPTHIDLTGCRALTREGLRMRCLARHCPCRPDLPADEEPVDVNEELPQEDLADDTDDGEVDLGFEGEGDEEGPEDADEARLIQCSADSQQTDDAAHEDKKPYVVNLWPRAAAKPLKYHQRLCITLLKARTRTHLVLVTRSAHPGLLVAARLAGLKVIALILGCSEHSRAHGKKLLRAMLAAEKLPIARTLVAQEALGRSFPKRVLDHQLQFIHLAAPRDQVVQVRDVEPEPESGWRAGLNLCPTDLPEKVAKLEADEIAENGFELREVGPDKKICLAAGRSYGERDIVCKFTGLLYDSQDTLGLRATSALARPPRGFGRGGLPAGIGAAGARRRVFGAGSALAGPPRGFRGPGLGARGGGRQPGRRGGWRGASRATGSAAAVPQHG